MSSEISTIQSLRAVDAWIDVINANINGGVRTAFKSSRLKFAGSNVDVSRAGTSTSLPLQFPEPGLTTANTVIDFTQGAITASTEPTHLALQGPGFFKLRALTDPGLQPTTKYYYSRDGEFRWMGLPLGVTIQSGSGNILTGMPGATVYVLVNKDGLGVIDEGINLGNCDSIVHFIDDGSGVIVSGSWHYDQNWMGASRSLDDALNVQVAQAPAVRTIADLQSLTYSQYGATVFHVPGDPVQIGYGPVVATSPEKAVDRTTTAILQKSLEASNASMTQSVPELSLAQKLFSALTKVLQTKQTNVDGVLNLVR